MVLVHKLCEKNVPWVWGKAQNIAVQILKERLSDEPVLCHYDPKLPIGMSADASAYGVGVISYFSRRI
jgi:hypothetical protein